MSYCDCDYTAPTFYDRASRKARKAHVCDECRGTIQPGEQYEAVVADLAQLRDEMRALRLMRAS